MATRIFELRTYTAAPAKRDALEARFRDHTVSIFARHGIEVVGFFLETNEDGTPNDRLVYLLAFDSRDAANAAWASFRDDPEWLATRAASEVDGPLTAHIESVFVLPSDFSPLV